MDFYKLAFGCWLLAGCASDAQTPAGTGGFIGNGGAIGNGGIVGSGGAIGNGGTAGNGGAIGNGGIVGSGGAIGNGGTIGTGGTPTSGGAGGGGDDPNKACGTTSLLTIPADPSERGPWVVGVQTVTIGRLTAEITYPAKPGSEAGKSEATYDIRDWLPKSPTQSAQYTPIADSESPAVKPIGGKLFRDLPIDDAHGPYPLVIFMHGTASFRIASGTLITQWASRGFVVIAADYPGLMLADQLCSAGCGCQASGNADYPGDISAQIAAVKAGTGPLAFLAGHVDTTRIGLSGHSVGGCTVAALTKDPAVQVVMPLSAAAPTPTSASLKSTLYVSGMSDTVFNYATGSGIGNVVCPNATGSVSDAYTASASSDTLKKRLVGVTGGGHLVPTDLCQKNADGNNAITVLHNHHYCAVDSVAIIGLPALFDCGAADFDWQIGMKDVDYATTAALEETLMCQDRKAAFANLKTALTTIGDFKEAP
jgi:dienelactone hydrolase